VKPVRSKIMTSTFIKRAYIPFTAALAVSLILSGSYVTAQNTYTWTDTTSGDWGNSSNWDTAPVFAAVNEFLFHSAGVPNLSTFMGSSNRTIGGLRFSSHADSDIIIRTYSTNSGSGGSNRILTFENGSDPVFITVEEGTEGNIQVPLALEHSHQLRSN
jgi:hypothetical protein